MSWRIVIAAIAISLLLGLTIVLVPGSVDLQSPRFVRGAAPPARPGANVHYDWAGLAPFVGGKVWLWEIARTNRHCVWYDLEARQVIGELVNAAPVFCTRDQTKLLCEGYPPWQTSLKQKLFSYLEKSFLGKILLPKINRADAYWLLDLRDNSARRLGELSQLPGTGSHWRPSPDFRYGCNVPNNAEEGLVFFLCDLKTGAFEKIRFSGDVQGWWDDTRLLVRDPGKNFVLFDVVSRNTKVLFSAGLLQDTLRELNLTNYPGEIRAINEWNGNGCDFYFALQSASYSAGESFLFKASCVDPALKLIYRRFKFEHLGRLDASATLYLYNGEPGVPGGGGNGAVLLRNLTNNLTTTLVPPDNSRQYYSLPRFYGGEVIYVHHPMLWRINLNGSNNVPLLPGGAW